MLFVCLLAFLVRAGDRVTVLGFAFAHDIARLAPLAADDGSADGTLPYVDIQKVAMTRAGSNMAASRGRTPGLANVTACWLRVALDKEQQCSDWDARPLSQRQMQYAASDAAVLVEIAEAMALAH